MGQRPVGRSVERGHGGLLFGRAGGGLRLKCAKPVTALQEKPVIPLRITPDLLI
ncbi:hypothetical protein C882_2600 [Caenispirillum salinarum AK4]|uniref:Uncharacterized protein n=1 Tax=Caenispirillum salinarum AK4 TaxID=1238182 RepID=K9HWC1_9PROT|nr:hypothetical protein C882_2600 [Caenispirillum salinarum AK4]